MLFSYLECGVDAVESGGSNTAGITGSFSAGIESRGRDGLEGVGVTRNTDGTAAAALDTDNDGIVSEESRVLTVKVAETLL